MGKIRTIRDRLDVVLAYARLTGKKVIANFSLKKEYHTFSEADLTIEVDKPVDISKGYIQIDKFK